MDRQCDPTTSRTAPTVEVPRGCDCVCGNHHGMAEAVPVAFLVERDGKQMRLCTRCDFRTDKRLALLVTPDMPSEPYFEFDPLGWLCLVNEMAKASDEKATGHA